MNDEPINPRPTKRRRLSHQPHSPALQPSTPHKVSSKWNEHQATKEEYISPQTPSGSSQGHMNAPHQSTTLTARESIYESDDEVVETSDTEEMLLAHGFDDYEEETESLPPAAFDDQQHLTSSSPIENRSISPPVTFNDSDGNESLPDHPALSTSPEATSPSHASSSHESTELTYTAKSFKTLEPVGSSRSSGPFTPPMAMSKVSKAQELSRGTTYLSSSARIPEKHLTLPHDEHESDGTPTESDDDWVSNTADISGVPASAVQGQVGKTVRDSRSMPSSGNYKESQSYTSDDLSLDHNNNVPQNDVPSLSSPNPATQGASSGKAPTPQPSTPISNRHKSNANSTAETMSLFYSPSLTPPPPTPYTRRTRDSNKYFKPYTDYKKQYGDKELLRLEQEERRRHGRRRNGEMAQAEDPEFDETYVESQAQEDDDSVPMPRAFGKGQQTNRIARDTLNESPDNHKPGDDASRQYEAKKGKTLASEEGKSVARRWNTHTRQYSSPQRPNITESRRPNLILEDEELHRLRDVIKRKGRKEVANRPNHSGGEPQPASSSKGKPSDFVHQMMRMYEDDDDDELNILLGTGTKAGNNRRQRVESVASDSQTEGSHHSSPLNRSSSIRKSTVIVEDEDESLETETRTRLHRAGSHERDRDSDTESSRSSDSGNQDSESNEGSDGKVDRQRERILKRMWPAMMIEKNMEKARQKELQREQMRREAERSKHYGSHSGSNEEDGAEEDNTVLAPGESKRTLISRPDRMLIDSVSIQGSDDNEVPPVKRPNQRQDTHIDIIDLTSDRESLDDDDAEGHDYPDHDVLVDDENSSDDDGWGRDQLDDPSAGLEAMEDNTISGGGGRSLYHSSRTSIKKVPTRPTPSRNRHGFGLGILSGLRQTKIDRMLNRTHKSSRSRKAPHSVSMTRSRAEKSIRHHSPDRAKPSARPKVNLVVGSEQSRSSLQTTRRFEPSRSKGKYGSHQPKQVTVTLSEGTNKWTGRVEKSQAPRDGLSEPTKIPDFFEVIASSEFKSHRKGDSDNSQNTRTSLKRKRVAPNISQQPVERASANEQGMNFRSTAEDPDSRIEISLKSALAFGMRRHRLGFTVANSSWLAQGNLNNLIQVLASRKIPEPPPEIHFSPLVLGPSTPTPYFQTQFPAICDILYEFATNKVHAGSETYTNTEALMRFVCLYVSWAAHCRDPEIREMINLAKDQLAVLMEKIDRHLLPTKDNRPELNHALLSVHWFAVELSNRMTKALVDINIPTSGSTITLKDHATDDFTIMLMSRLLELGIRRVTASFQDNSKHSNSRERYALEIWIGLIHITTLLPRTEAETIDASTTFWRLVAEALETCRRGFSSAVHETEFIFSVIFSLCSISSVDPLGVGQETRLLGSYWPLVCNAIENLDLTHDPRKRHQFNQKVQASKDIYTAMIFARCSVLAFRWEWSLAESQGSKKLFDLLRGILKGRQFMNLIHEQSDFPLFITRKNMRLLFISEPKDSIQTIVIKMMIRKVRESQENMASAKKWISLLANTSSLEFTKENPPLHKELSALFNQFTIKIVLFYIDPTPTNARVHINSSKKIVDFQKADHNSRQVCIRAAMVYGRFCRHFSLPLDDVVIWMSEMGEVLLEDRKELGPTASEHQKKELMLVCALLVASLRDILLSSIEDPEYREPLQRDVSLDSLVRMFGFITRLISTTRDLDAAILEIGLLLNVIFDLRDESMPPSAPQPLLAVQEEESQEDYGFEPIDFNDPAFVEVMRAHEQEEPRNDQKSQDISLARGMLELSTPIASIIHRIGSGNKSEQRKARLDIWIRNWARLAVLIAAHNLKAWDDLLQQTPSSLGPPRDVTWQTQTEPNFCYEVLKRDTRAYLTNSQHFIRIWFITLSSPDLFISDYVNLVIEVDGRRHFLFRDLSPLPETLNGRDDDFIDAKIEMFKRALDNLNQSWLDRQGGLISSNTILLIAQAIEGATDMLAFMRHNVAGDQGPSSDYLAFCAQIIGHLQTLGLGNDPSFKSALQGAWIMDLYARLNPG
ncbi:hypothetical protein CPB86DRAFT_783868 [Serendipita vermifera]|nr:hypothetical protein CPB86DRAFT_783868 [Serendipita vermifera]